MPLPSFPLSLSHTTALPPESSAPALAEGYRSLGLILLGMMIALALGFYLASTVVDLRLMESETIGLAGQEPAGAIVPDSQQLTVLARTVQVSGLGLGLLGPSVTPSGSPLRYEARFVGGSVPYSYVWSWGDGLVERSSRPTITHAYERPGVYLVTVNGADARGSSITVAAWQDVAGVVEAGVPPIPSRALPANATGFGDYYLEDDDRTPFAPYREALRSANVQLHRGSWWEDAIGFEVIQSAESRAAPGVYQFDWDRFDRATDEIFSWASSLLLNTAGVPPPLALDGGRLDAPTNLDLYWFHYFVGRHLVERGHGGQMVEIGYEPDIGKGVTDGPGPFWHGTVDDFTDLMQTIAAAWRAADPTVRIGAPGLSTPRVSPGTTQARYLSEPLHRVAADGSPVNFYSVHFYDSNPLSVSSGLRSALDDLQAAIEELDLPSAPLVISQSGPYGSDDPANPGFDSNYRAAHLAALYIEAANSDYPGGVAAVVPWTLLGGINSSGVFPSGHGSGLIQSDGRTRAAFQALRLLGRLRGTPASVAGEARYSVPSARGVTDNPVATLVTVTPEGGFQILLATNQPVEGEQNGEAWYFEPVPVSVTLRLRSAEPSPRRLVASGFVVDASHGNPLANPADQDPFPLPDSLLPLPIRAVDRNGTFFDVNVMIGPNSVVLLELRPD